MLRTIIILFCILGITDPTQARKNSAPAERIPDSKGPEKIADPKGPERIADSKGPEKIADSTAPKTARSQITNRYSYWESFGEFDATTCNLGWKLKKEIKNYQEIVDLIMKTAVNGNFKGETYKHLAHFTDNFGSRLVTSPAYGKAVAFFTRQLLNIPTLAGRVFVEDVPIPNWKRGTEFAEILSPIMKRIQVKGMGLTIPTRTVEGIEADAIVIDTLEELRQNKFNVAGKILVFNLNFEETKLIMTTAASRGALLGAAAVLVKSPAPFSLYSIHATLLQYTDKAKRIPAATITLEDAELMARLYKKGKTIRIKLILENMDGNTTIVVQNVLGDFDGREKLDEYVVASGYMDSWDIGQGAVDGLSAILTYELARLFDELKLYPRRSVRTALWAGTKFGNFGVQKYLDNHENDLNRKYSAALSANLGCRLAKGFIFSGNPQATCIVHDILRLFSSGTSGSLIHVNGTVSDASFFSTPMIGISNSPAAVPSLTLNGDDGYFYWYADSAGDTVSMMESSQLDICLGMYTAMTYVLADLQDILPR